MQESMARILLLGSNLAEYRRFEAMLSSIQQSSFQLLWCEQLENGKAEIVSGNYDAVLLDCQHQPDTALLLLQETLEQGCLLPIIALTAEVDNTASQQALQYGAADYLSLDNLDDYVFQRCIGYAIDKSQVEKKINQLNLYDPLTGIPNRMLFRQTMERAIELAKTQQISLALLLINLDGFKKVNESYGSEAGDRLVAMVATNRSPASLP